MSNRTQHITMTNPKVGAVSYGDNAPTSGQLTICEATAAAMAGPDSGLATTLIVVVADVERTAVMKQVNAVNGASFARQHFRDHTVYALGRISKTDVLLAQVSPGTVTPDAAGVSAVALLQNARPDYVILTGICYGLKNDARSRPQQLGDVAVANQLRLIAHHKVIGESQLSRGGSVHPSTTLLDRLRSAVLDWRNPAAVHIGPVLSESVLVNSASYRQRLKELEPEAIAGEMEGSAIYAAAVRDKVDWALVKGVCDWGYDKSDDYQELAANNAASLVVHMMCLGGLDPVGSV